MKTKFFAIAASIFLFLGAASAAAPDLSNPSPQDNATGVSKDANLSLEYTDSDGDSGTVTFYSSKDVEIGEETSVSNGSTVSVDPALSYGEELEWYAVASDGNSSTSNATAGNFSFQVIEELLHIKDKVVEDQFTSEAFTAETLGDLTVNAALDTNESLEVTLTGYNSTEETGNTTYTVNDGSNSFNPSQFTENTSTYILEFNASNGSVVINDLRVTGTTNSTQSVSGAAPGGGLFSGFMTGNFFGSISNAVMAIPSAIMDFLAGIGTAIGGVFA